MAQSKILLDTNCYIRLAKSIHPLLDVTFGAENYCLYVLRELDTEFSRSKRLQTQFEWVDHDEYQDNRKKRLTISKKNKTTINTTVDFLRQYKIENKLSVSDVDILCLAHSFALDIYVVTDDGDMLDLASVFGFEKVMKTLELMHLMLMCKHIDVKAIRKIGAYWEYISDKPASFRQDYIRLFGESPP